MAVTCTVNGCFDAQLTKKSGLCSRHYQRMRRYGSPEAGRIRNDDLARYWSYVDKRGPDDCWPWTGTTRHGYGRLKVNGHMVGATRYFVAVVLGEPLAADEDVCHHCDNPPCQNRRHMFISDAEGNMRDCVAKGRWGGTRGEDNRNSVLTETKVREIRRRHAAGDGSWRSLAREYRVNKSTIERVLTRKTWTHI